MSLHAGVTFAQGATLTLAEVLARAREQAPDVVAARLMLEETRARLVGASQRFQSNPELDGAVGPRWAADGNITDWEIGLSQAFESGGRKTARTDAANAAVAQATANIEEAQRLAMRLSADAYFRALHAGERVQLLAGAEQLSASVHAIADRRFRAGDIAVLDVNIARAALARVRAQREGAEAERAAALGELRQLLRLDEVQVAGSLAPRTAPALDAALQSALQRPELRALEAAIREAEADIQLGASYGKPNYGLGVRYSHEEGDQILLGGLTVSLPVAAKGQEQRAAATARAARMREALSVAQARVRQEVRAAYEAYTRRLAALRVLESDAIAGLDENERLTTRSFEVGQLGLPELLLLRREILDTRAQYLDALLEAALSQIDLDTSAAILR
jgi:cobalt-zinc-cadmium efflux system outer membrane protein